MKIAILDARQGKRDAGNSITVAYRNLIALRDYLGADLFVNAGDISKQSDYDAIICGFGSTSTERERSTDFLARNKQAKILWLVGEYEQSTFAPLFYSKRKFDVIKNFEHPLKNKMAEKQHFVNINTLAYHKPNATSPKKYGSIYYGRWRQDRVKYFRKYLQGDMYLSTHSKNAKMFHHNGCSPKFIRPFQWAQGRESLNLFERSLYIEDEFTHRNYNCLANRFYEALMCNVMPVFDLSCVGTLDKSGYKGYQSLVVESPCQVESIAHDYDLLRQWQEQALVEREQTLSRIRDIIFS